MSRVVFKIFSDKAESFFSPPYDGLACGYKKRTILTNGSFIPFEKV